jgi:hypothetical protein
MLHVLPAQAQWFTHVIALRDGRLPIRINSDWGTGTKVVRMLPPLATDRTCTTLWVWSEVQEVLTP